MSVTFLVEDGTMPDGANSYCSVAEADDINSIDTRTTWAALDTASKQKLLMMATRWMDQKIYWFGSQVNADQPLRWPRCGMIDREGFEYLKTVIPKPVRELCARLASTFNDQHPEDMEQAGGVRRFRADVVEIEWQSGYAQNMAPVYVGAVIGGLGYGPDDRGPRRIRRF